MRIGMMGRTILSSVTTDRLDIVAASQMIGLETALVDAAAAAGTDAPAASGVAAGAERMKGKCIGSRSWASHLSVVEKHRVHLLAVWDSEYFGRSTQFFAIWPLLKQWKQSPFAARH